MPPEIRTCQSCKSSFQIDAADFNFYRKIDVPSPTWCPRCRAIRRQVFWNERNLYRKKDARTGEEIFSTYPEQASIQIYHHDYWWSDNWNPMNYGREYDFSRTFFEQLKELNFAVPWPSKSVRGMVNSDYCNQASYLKNCYLCFNGNTSENSLYCVGFNKLRECMEVRAAIDIELCYEVYQCGESFQCFFSSDVIRCRDVWFSRDCVGCSNCFGCVNLHHKQYCFFNEQLTKEAYQRRFRETWTGSYASLDDIRRRVNELWLRSPHKYYHGIQNVNVTGDYVYRSKNTHDAYEAGDLEDTRYSENLANGIKDSYDYTNWGEHSELMYESISCGDNCRNVKFCFDSWPAMQDSEYCLNCHSSANLFACVGLRQKQYCIFNKQYSKEGYHKLRTKIIAHMNEMPYTDKQRRVYKYGEFFPPEFSPLAYNETAAYEYYPTNKEDATRSGYLWREPDPKTYEITLTAEKLSDHIADTSEAIVKETIQCASCRRAYRILPQELAFYKRFLIPLPRKCVDCRYFERLSIRNPRALYERSCQCSGSTSESSIYKNVSRHFHDVNHCPNDFKTSYPQDHPAIIYCEPCYQAEVA